MASSSSRKASARTIQTGRPARREGPGTVDQPRDAPGPRPQAARRRGPADRSFDDAIGDILRSLAQQPRLERALEIPLALAALADTEGHDALIALGCIVRGETYHFELVSNESGAGITRVGLDYGMPIANAVLTTENDEQAEVRMTEKGSDAARVAVEMANLLLALEELQAEEE